MYLLFLLLFCLLAYLFLFCVCVCTCIGAFFYYCFILSFVDVVVFVLFLFSVIIPSTALYSHLIQCPSVYFLGMIMHSLFLLAHTQCFLCVSHFELTNLGEAKDVEVINRWAFLSESIIHGNPSGLDNTISCHGILWTIALYVVVIFTTPWWNNILST